MKTSHFPENFYKIYIRRNSSLMHNLIPSFSITAYLTACPTDIILNTKVDNI